MDLKTTTAPQRNSKLFRQARSMLEDRGASAPLEVLQAGPGLAVKYLGRLSARTVPGWDVFRRIETGVRRLPWPSAFYESYESADLLRAFDGLPVRLTVVDINPRVLRVMSGMALPRPVTLIRADLGEAEPASLAPLYGAFDLVVALSMISRVKRRGRDNARANLRRLTRPGGLLLATGIPATSDCVPIADRSGFYRVVG